MERLVRHPSPASEHTRVSLNIDIQTPNLGRSRKNFVIRPIASKILTGQIPAATRFLNRSESIGGE